MRRSVFLTLVALATVLAGGLRVASHDRVFTDSGIRLLGNDAYYHALRAERAVAAFPLVPVRDPGLAFPDTVAIPWPPLLDGAVAWTAVLLHRTGVTPDVTLLVGASISVIIAAATIPATAALGLVLLGPTEGVAAAFLMSALPAHAAFTRLGDFDQHGAEVLLLACMLLAFVGAWRGSPSKRLSWAADAVLSLCVSAAFLTWQGSALHLGLLAGALSAWWVSAPRSDLRCRTMALSLARAGLLSAVTLGVGVALFASPSALGHFSLSGLNGFHVSACALLGAFGLVLLSGGRTAGPASERALRLSIAVIACLLVAWIAPGLRASVLHGWTAVSSSTGWYENIREFDPLLFAGFTPLGGELLRALSLTGLAFPLAVASALILVRYNGHWAKPTAEVTLLLWLAVSLSLLTFVHQRFLVYASLPLALLVASLWARAAELLAGRLGRRWRVPVLIGGCVGTLLPTVTWHMREFGTDTETPDREALFQALDWLRTREAPTENTPAVFAEWDYGHTIQYLARKPVTVSPFGTDLGPEPMADFAKAFLGTDPDSLDAVLSRRGIGFLLLANPVTEAHFAHSFAPRGTPVAVTGSRSWRSGIRVEVTPHFWDIAASRLFFSDGTVPAGYDGEAFGHYRLVLETGEAGQWGGRPHPAFKLFERVPGAILHLTGAAPGARVTARAELAAPNGPPRLWFTTVVADPQGEAELRVPYATGRNGDVTVGAYRITMGREQGTVVVTEAAVLQGSRIEVPEAAEGGVLTGSLPPSH